MSLTTLFGLLYAAVAMFTFAAVGMYLYQSLVIQLEAREDAELVQKLEYIRHLLEETPSVEAIRQDSYRFVNTVAGHDGLYLLLKAADGSTLMDNYAGWSSLPALPVTPAQDVPSKSSVGRWAIEPGLTARAVSAWGYTRARDQEPVQITLAHTTSATNAILSSYRIKVLVAAMSGALLAGMLGYILVRRGLRSLNLVARQAQSITAERLDTRLDAAQAPQELQALVQSFNAMLDRLHASFRRLSQFSADLAHDFRTPINNLMVQTQVALSKSRPAEEYEALLESNVEEYERLARMVDGMLFLARVDHAQVTLDKKLLDTGIELRRIADYFEGVAEEAGVRLTVKANELVLADATLFQRAVNNLVVNAIRHTPKGESIQLMASDRQHVTEIVVMNPGRPIDKTHIPKLFDRFYRADRARSDSASSAGLGLAIVESIVTLHGGWAEVKSANGVTAFYLFFPKMSGKR